jgi:hypothetical protein
MPKTLPNALGLDLVLCTKGMPDPTKTIIFSLSRTDGVTWGALESLDPQTAFQEMTLIWLGVGLTCPSSALAMVGCGSSSISKECSQQGLAKSTI